MDTKDGDGAVVPDQGGKAVLAFRVSEAQKATERGWALLPLNGKVPTQKAWQRAPRPTFEEVTAWAREGNVGLRTGKVSGVVVIDDDTPDGSGVAELNLPLTPTVITGSGKFHYYFKAPEKELGNSTGALPEHVDVRGDGGQVVYVGSIHPTTGKAYVWAPGRSPKECDLAELPQNVLDLIRAPKAEKNPRRASKPRARRDVPIDQAARDELKDAIDRVAQAQEGARNETLYDEARAMGRWVAAGKLDRADVAAVLQRAARDAGLPDAEARKTTESGLAAAERAQSARPTITLEGGELPNLVTKAEDALLSTGAQLFQRGSQVVRIVRAAASTMKEVVRRAEGVLMLAVVEVPYLVELLTRSARWFKPTRTGLVDVDCPDRIAKTYLARAGHWRLQTLLGLIEAPTLRPDGSILQEPGFDATTGLYFDPGGMTFPVVPETPTKEDAERALAIILNVLKGFPFMEPCDRSAAVAAIMTALIRPSLRTAPMFAFRAPVMGSGKSLLADVVAMIATGRVASMMSQGKDEDEDKKRLLSILVEGIAVACIDNVEHEFYSPAMCTVLTQESWRDRILGKTGTATVPTTTTWLVTGNNILFRGDIVTRVVVCDLDPGVEKPEERKFGVNLHDYVPRHRGELVVAGLTVLRAFAAAGRPGQDLVTFGRFEEWSDWVRSALVWLGQADPCAGRDRLDRVDPVTSALGDLLEAWYATFRSGGQTVGGVIETIGGAAADTKLVSAVQAVAQGQGVRADGKRLGSYLARSINRIVDGLRIERVGQRQGSVIWRVMPTPERVARDEAADQGVGPVTSVSHFPPVQHANRGGLGGEGGATPFDQDADGDADVVHDSEAGEIDSPKSQNPLCPSGASAPEGAGSAFWADGAQIATSPVDGQALVVVDAGAAPSTADVDPVFPPSDAVPVLRRSEADDELVAEDGRLVRFSKLTHVGNGIYLTPAGQKVRVLGQEEEHRG